MFYRESLKTTSTETTKQMEQLNTLISTTASATQDIQRTLLEAINQSTRLEELLRAGQLSSEEQADILKHIRARNTRREDLAERMINAAKSQATTVNRIAQTVRGAMVQAQSARQRLERLVKTVVPYLKTLIVMVARNTRLLLQLQQTLDRLEMKIMRDGPSPPILMFHDPFGEVMALPWQMCDSWKVGVHH